MRDVHRKMLHAADALANANTHAEHISITTDLLALMLPGDLTFRAEVAFGERPVRLNGDPEVIPYASVLDRLGPTHPDLQSYVRQPKHQQPRRLSDLVCEGGWRRTELWDEMFKALGGLHQLSILIDLQSVAAGTAWIISRSRVDFSDDDVALAAALQPLVRLSERLHPSQETRGMGRSSAGAVPFPTAREAQVLALLAQGWTAAAIARRCGITPRTVRKHLENLYAKLECSDRLLAVQRARDLGWLTTG